MQPIFLLDNVQPIPSSGNSGERPENFTRGRFNKKNNPPNYPTRRSGQKSAPIINVCVITFDIKITSEKTKLINSNKFKKQIIKIIRL